jgi:hypothetical protein
MPTTFNGRAVFKVLSAQGTSHINGFAWSLPSQTGEEGILPGQWHEIAGAMRPHHNSFSITPFPALWWGSPTSRLFEVEFDGDLVTVANFSPPHIDELVVSRLRLLREVEWWEVGVYDAAIAGAPIRRGQFLAPCADDRVLAPADGPGARTRGIALEDQAVSGARVRVASAPREHLPVDVLSGAPFPRGAKLIPNGTGRAVPTEEGASHFALALAESESPDQLVPVTMLTAHIEWALRPMPGGE